MSAFEDYLTSIGYEKFAIERKGKNVAKVRIDKTYYSTMDGCWAFYIKDGKEIMFGLNEFGKPPTLIHPRPKGCFWDDEMNRVLKENTPEEVYKMIYDSIPNVS